MWMLNLLVYKMTCQTELVNKLNDLNYFFINLSFDQLNLFCILTFVYYLRVILLYLFHIYFQKKYYVNITPE